MRVLLSRPVQDFLLRFYLSSEAVDSLLLVSPTLGSLRGTRVTLEAVCAKVTDESIPTFVVTCPPESDSQQQAIDTLCTCPTLELRFNAALHAKIYAARMRTGSRSFALLTSGNLTQSSITNRIEVGILLGPHGEEAPTFEQITWWGLNTLRTMTGTRLVKKRSMRRRYGNGVS